MFDENFTKVFTVICFGINSKYKNYLRRNSYIDYYMGEYPMT